MCIYILLFVIWLCLLLTTLRPCTSIRHQLDWYCQPAFKKKKAGTGRMGRRDSGVRSYRKFVKCDDRLKRMIDLTLIRLFKYRSTGTRVLIVHDKHTTYLPSYYRRVFKNLPNILAKNDLVWPLVTASSWQINILAFPSDISFLKISLLKLIITNFPLALNMA